MSPIFSKVRLLEQSGILEKALEILEKNMILVSAWISIVHCYVTHSWSRDMTFVTEATCHCDANVGVSPGLMPCHTWPLIGQNWSVKASNWPVRNLVLMSTRMTDTGIYINIRNKIIISSKEDKTFF